MASSGNNLGIGIPVNQQGNGPSQPMATRQHTAQSSSAQPHSSQAQAQAAALAQRRAAQAASQAASQAHAQGQVQGQTAGRQTRGPSTLGNQHGLPYNPNPRHYQFAETTDEILKKFENEDPSLEFHIHENHYRFGNQDGVISKSNGMVKEFLECVVRGEIPGAVVEVLRDSGVKFYEGCLILKVIDHRKVDKVLNVAGDKENGKNNGGDDGNNNTSNSNVPVSLKPKSYRCLLKPTQLSMFYDLLYQTDSALQRFSDTLGISMEAELLSITKRKLDLSVPSSDSIWIKSEFPKTVQQKNEEDGTEEITGVIHNHRVESTDPDSKAFKPYRELHEDSPQQASEYEQFMTILNDSKKINGVDMNSSETLQFSRLRFIEQWKLRKEKLKQGAINQQNRSDISPPLIPPGIGSNLNNSNSNSSSNNNSGGAQQPSQGQGQGQQQLTPRQQAQLQLQQQQQRLKLQQQSMGQYSGQFPGPNNDTSMSTALQQQQLNLQQQKALAQQKLASGNLVDEDGKKVKKPKKLTKKQQEKLAREAQMQVAGKTLPGAGIPNNGLLDGEKKKRGTYKKKKKDE